MEKSLIKTLLRIVHSPDEKTASSRGLAQFANTHQIGRQLGRSYIFSLADKQVIKELLKIEEGVDADSTQPDAWDGLSRTDSLALGGNEKLSQACVRLNRVAVKALLGRPLCLGDEKFNLPAASHLELDWQQVEELNRHDGVMLVENWEAFEKIHQLQFEPNIPSSNPLVLFRGMPQVYSQNYVVALLEKLKLPVFAFVDYDPAGLMIAVNTPCFTKLVMPPEAMLEAAFSKCTNSERFQKQLPETQALLEQCPHPDIRHYWQIYKRAGVALPQEYFCQT
ncbi:hypothetical protein HQ393_07130 [Chitinibacter bivalviorum]|uniref:DUF7281 domain-containing protein n=1 Tax=Chitinibacter bivalviorum TaxID=2739434 RepID=A0A7H9BJ78_9NEIS|nr:hypothetical protein [Chitinibacter bivalviorum]QLG88051.1 hypothetical protein HQ393_07130 [Chitinibacter bivalviorum]